MAVINKDVAYMALPMSIRRGNPFPVDDSTVWYDKEQLDNYAKTSAVAYVGQILVYVNESEQTVEAYMIQNVAGNLIKLAASTSSGNLDEDVAKLQSKVSTLESSVGSKGAESSIVATNLWAAIEEIKAAYEVADASINSNLRDNYYSKTETDQKIDEKVDAVRGSTYTPVGSKAFAELPALSASEVGKVYNVTDDFTTNENFLEGAGKQYSAGTNVVCVKESDDVYKWDVLGNFIDMSKYSTTEDMQSALENKVDKVLGSSLVSDEQIAKLAALANIKSVSEEMDLSEDGVLSVKEISQDKVTGLPGALANKVDVVPGKQLSTEDFTSELKAKLDGIAAGANANVIEILKMNGTIVEVKDKTADIPLAKDGYAGVVIGSSGENEVGVREDGVMEVNSLNVSKLVQSEGSTLILDGGSAAL